MEEVVEWALHATINGNKIFDTENNKYIKGKNCDEKEWGNKKINETNNNQWTTKLGEGLVKWQLEQLGYKVTKPCKKEIYKPDWETDEFIVEVKTRNWSTTGTAGEKVLGCPLKYADIPLLYGKPLVIVCVAYQEYELTHGHTQIFNKLTGNKLKILHFFESLKIHYVKFSELKAQLSSLLDSSN